MQNKIFVDLDGVLVNFNKSVLNLLKLDVNDVSIRSHLKVNEPSKGIPHLVGKSKFWSCIGREKENFWQNLELFPWADDLYRDLHKLTDNVCILTSPSDDPTSCSGKSAFIRKHFKTRNFLIGPPKYFCASPQSLLVDDTPKKIEQFAQHGGHTYLFPNHYLIEDGDITYEQILNEITVAFNKVG